MEKKGPHLDDESEDFEGDEADSDTADFEGDPIVGRVELTTEDFTSVWAILPQNRGAFMRFGLWLVVIPIFWLIFSWLNTGANGEPTSLPWTVMASPVAAMVLIAFAVFRSRNVWAKNAVADLRGAEGVEFRFDATGFSFNPPGRQLQHAWSTLYRWLETARAFVIYTGPINVIVVPKRAFAAAEQARLRELFRQLVPNRPLRGAEVGRPIVRTVGVWLVLVIVFLALWQFLDSK